MKEKKYNYIILLIFTVIVLYFSLKDNFTTVINYILNMNIWWIIYSLFLMFAYWFFKSLIIKKYVNYYNKEYTFMNAFKLEAESMFFNGITPFSSGGQPFQVLMLKKDGVRISEGTNVIVVDSFIHQFSIFILAVFSIVTNFFLKLYPASVTIRNLSIFGFVINVLFMVFLVLVCFNKKFNKFIAKWVIKFLNKIRLVKDKEKMIDKWNDYLETLHDGSKVILSNKKGFALAVLYSVIALTATYLIPLTVAFGMGINTINPLTSIVTATYVALIGMFVPIPGGTGGLEFAFTSLFGNFVSGSIISSLMLVWRFITYYLGILVGGIILNMDKKHPLKNE